MWAHLGSGAYLNEVGNPGADSLRIDLLTVSIPSLLGKRELEILWGLNNAHFFPNSSTRIKIY